MALAKSPAAEVGRAVDDRRVTRTDLVRLRDVARQPLYLPSFLGVSMIVAGLRILFMNMAVREAERTRRARLERHE